MKEQPQHRFLSLCFDATATKVRLGYAFSAHESRIRRQFWTVGLETTCGLFISDEVGSFHCRLIGPQLDYHSSPKTFHPTHLFLYSKFHGSQPRLFTKLRNQQASTQLSKSHQFTSPNAKPQPIDCDRFHLKVKEIRCTKVVTSSFFHEPSSRASKRQFKTPCTPNPAVRAPNSRPVAIISSKLVKTAGSRTGMCRVAQSVDLKPSPLASRFAPPQKGQHEEHVEALESNEIYLKRERALTLILTLPLPQLCNCPQKQKERREKGREEERARV
ncbi:hypothetical protein MBM_03362 [Drepanopeziza brunnea f. sp. 'multigermtubi' MB_m1]|uniref:Uncharacterized protein n=1 Tax=Marssonina brunnea f. sp. multigermtubi (strain MB_m1) TaxID=1072389 RepID=K1XZU2_MARBU|nr:uncharacterized protein MBM_03362 [Drepanopeziza brunnea f. sp. 'multigermtubi' MB_m1]EKD18369.1 hypothetical protein MBM_03362 [Drepanopeziza brunnea f. sp. 'multigermtubi' MB_m1]